MLALLASLLPNLLLNGLQSYLQATTTATVETEKTKRQITLATIQGVVAVRQAQAAVIQTGMSHRLFWIPWLLASVPVSAWFGWGVLDSLTGGALPHVATLPPQLKEYADIVWQNIFLSGGVVAGSSVIASAIGKLKK